MTMLSAVDPGRGLNQRRSDVDGGVFGFERDMLGDEGVPKATGVHEATRRSPPRTGIESTVHPLRPCT